MSDDKYVDRAIEVAKKGLGRTKTNPIVGACLVSGDDVVAEGAHLEFGGNHAEENLLEDVGTIPDGSILYLTLEPCVREGKTPPCLNGLARSGIEQYVILSKDPHPSVDGAGIQGLRELGFSVDVIGNNNRYNWLNRHYFHGVRSDFPWIDLKLAMSADGYIATPRRNSQWITGERSRDYGHRLRSRVDAVMVGAGTLRSDDPRLTDRVTDADRQPAAVVVARSADGIDPTAHLFRNRADKTTLVVPPTFSEDLIAELRSLGVDFLIADLYDGRYRWNQVLPRLRDRSIGRVLVEGGSALAGSLLETGHVNECHLFYGGKIFGNGIPSVGTASGVRTVNEAPEGQLIDHRRFGNDLYARRYFGENTDHPELRNLDPEAFVNSDK